MKHVFFVLILFIAGSVSAQEINWMTFEEALAAQQKKPKKIFMDVYTVWCGPCKLLDKNTFSNKDLAAYVNKHFYPVKFNGEGNEELNYQGKKFGNPRFDPKRKGRNGVHDLTVYLQVNAYPTMVFFDEKGQTLMPVRGYLTPDKLEVFLKFFKNDDHKKIRTQQDFDAYQKNFKYEFKI